MTIKAELYEKLMACRDIAASSLLAEYQDASLESVMDLLAESFLSQKKRSLEKKTHAEVVAQNKTLTANTRRNILNRDRCCQFKDPATGKICGSTFNLEVDHKQPRWAQGNHAAENLQVLCRPHNNHKYRRENNLTFISS
jgi:5-methylcytosine-specific restriction endonuclease McrA